MARKSRGRGGGNSFRPGRGTQLFGATTASRGFRAGKVRHPNQFWIIDVSCVLRSGLLRLIAKDRSGVGQAANVSSVGC